MNSFSVCRRFFRRLSLPIVFLGLFVQANAALAQEELQCLDLPLPAGCESFDFDVELTSVTDTFGIWGPLLVGDVLSGTFTAYADAPDVDTDPDSGRYLNSIECVRLDMGDREMIVVLTPEEISIPPSPSDPGVTIMNDVPSVAGPFTLFTDSATFLMGGPGAMLLDASPTELALLGGGGFSFSYGDVCISGIDTPCPPTVLVDDAFPSAPGDLTGITSSQMTFDYLTLGSSFATASGDLLAIDPGAPFPCPEPGFSSAIMSGLVLLGLLGRRRRDD